MKGAVVLGVATGILSGAALTAAYAYGRREQIKRGLATAALVYVLERAGIRLSADASAAAAVEVARLSQAIGELRTAVG